MASFDYFDIILKHLTSLLGHPRHAIYRISFTRDIPTKTEMSDGVGQVEVCRGEGLNIMDVDVVQRK